jgi:BirA family biotin operon repressor/biotin-[acetyl-CoA-carboxylase] ligase
LDKYNIIKLCSVDSTNNYVLSFRKSNEFKEGLVVFSEFQKKGRGQIGNIWESEKGKNLLVSILVEPDILLEKQFDISKIASSAVIDCLLSYGIKPKIKWPNDILVGNKKIAGILIQNIISLNGKITHSVVGIGLNVNQLIFDDYVPKATSLHLELKKNIILEEIEYKLLNTFRNAIKVYRSDQYSSTQYLNALFQKDKVVVFESKSQRFNGVIRGVDDSGMLLVETENLIKRFTMKEIKMLF